MQGENRVILKMLTGFVVLVLIVIVSVVPTVRALVGTFAVVFAILGGSYVLGSVIIDALDE